MIPRSIAPIAIAALVMTVAPVNAQEDASVTLSEALGAASTEGWTVVDAETEGVVPYQYADDPSNPAQLDVPYGDVEQATAGLFLFGDNLRVDCSDPAQLCSPGFEAPDQNSIYLGFSMTMAGEIPVDGADGNVINYSFPWITEGQEPFIELDAFPGDTWQDMSQVVVAEARSPFTLAHQRWVPGSGFSVEPTLTFGLANGDQIWVFVPVGPDPFGIREAVISTAILGVLRDIDRDGSVPLPQALSDAIATMRWGAAVHIHTGDFGRDGPSTITALPATPRGRGAGFLPPTSLTLLGFGDPVAIPTKAPDPAPGDDAPVDESAGSAAVDDPTPVAEHSADTGSGLPILPLGIGGAVALLLSIGIWRRRTGDDEEGTPERLPFVVPESLRPPETERESYVRDDGTKVEWWGVPGYAMSTTYTYTDGRVRVESSSVNTRDIKITRPDGTVESWSATEHPDHRRDRVIDGGYSRVDADGNLLESSDWDGTPPYPA